MKFASKSPFLGCLLLIGTLSSHAQISYQYQPSHVILEKAYEEVENGDTLDAIQTLETIHVSDTSYMKALGDRIFLLTEFGNAKKSLELLDKALKNPGNSEHRYFLQKVSALKELERFDDAAKTIEEGLEKFPYSSNLYLHKADLNKELDNIEKAVDFYEKAIFFNYYNVDAHTRLGLTYAENGYITEGLICITTAALIDNRSSLSKTRIAYLESLAGDNHEKVENPVEIPQALDLEEIDILFENRIALSDDYKVKSKLNGYNIVKSLHLLYEKLPKTVPSKPFWNENYLTLYAQLKEIEKFDHQIIYLFNSYIGVEPKVTKEAKKSKNDLSLFVRRTGEKIVTISGRNNHKDGIHPEGTQLHFSDGELTAYGNYTDGYPPVGVKATVDDWVYYHPNQVISSIGSYDKFGKRIGEWVWFFDNGDTSHVINFVEDKRVGRYRSYHKGNVISYDYELDENEEVQGLVKEKFVNGAKYAETNYKDNKKNGVQHYFNLTGGIRRTNIYNEEGLLSDSAISYYANGKIRSVEHFDNGELTGTATYYHNDGKTIHSTGKLEDGLKEGEWVFYHRNGKLKEKGSYKKGSPIDYWEVYDIDGILENSYTYDSNRKINGVSKTYYQGKLVREETFKNGTITGYVCYDLEGNIIGEGETKRNELAIETYYPNGNIQTQGKYEDGNRSGFWTFYYQNGSVSGVERYYQDKLNANDSSFYETGELNSIDPYNIHGDRDGLAYSLYKNGNIQSFTYYEEGIVNGISCEFSILGDTLNSMYYLNEKKYGDYTDYWFNGQPSTKINYFNNLRSTYSVFDTLGNLVFEQDIRLGDKTVKQTFANGNTKSIANYRNGVTHGKFQWFFPEGTIETEGEIFNGDRHGVWVWKNPNGTIDTRGEYNYGNQIGVWVYNDVLGRKESEGAFNANGERTGEWKYYHSNGKISLKRNYQDGKIEGKAEYFDDLGNLQYVLFYQQDFLIGYSYNDASGNLKEMIPLENETGKIEAYFANGKKSTVKEYYFGHVKGEYTKFRNNGAVVFTSNSENYMYEGEAVTYYSNGKKAESLTYTNDVLNGPSTYYYESGKPYLEAHYRAGKKHGTFKYYSPTGKLEKQLVYNTGTLINAL